MTLDSKAILEAILFVTEAPVPVGELAEVLEIPEDEVETHLVALRDELKSRGSGLVPRASAGGWRLYSHPDAYHHLERFSVSASARKISPAALEVLSVVAYEQPVSRAQINEIRGVDSDSAVRTLERLELIVETDRLPIPGNPAVYGTTDRFLEKVGISSLDDLPPLADHVPPSDVVGTLEETFRTAGE